MERALYFDKFRNIGFEKSERLVLNHSLERGKMGNLVILVGANNSGKSNVLDGINAFGRGRIEDRDVTMLSYAPEYRNPSLTMSLKDDDGNDYTIRIHKDGSKKGFYPTSKDEGEKIYTFADDIEALKADILWIVEDGLRNYVDGTGYVSVHPSRQDFSDLYHYLKQPLEKEAIIQKVLSTLDDSIRKYPTKRRWWDSFLVHRPQSKLAKEYVIKRHQTSGNEIEYTDDAAFKKFGITVSSQIINYVEKPIKNSDLSCHVSDLNTSNFMVSVFEKIGINKQEICTTYQAFTKLGNKGALTILQRKANQRLLAVADDFNRMYFVDDCKYSFEVSLESDKIYFSMFRGDNDIILDYQSTGFKWFFNLYFNLLSKNTLNAGDVLIMDEPATNLHVMGQIELRKFLKSFAMKNDLTIVIATHSPFLIDLDYLDELRVISMADNISKICNDFSAVNINDPDALKPIKTALTVNNHVLLDPDKTVVFVEGITDYNYLVAFKNKLNIAEDIVFLPIQGLGNVREKDSKEHQKELSKELIKIRKNNPVLLVDGDKAGDSMVAVNKDSALMVVSLKNIDPAFKQIEELFDAKDKAKLDLINENGKYNKHFGQSSNLKTYIEEYEFEQSTLDNFKKVLMHLGE